MKRCSGCGETRDFEFFYRCRRLPDGHQAWCIRCMRVYRRQPGVRAAYRITEQRWRDRQPRKPRVPTDRNEKGKFVVRKEVAA